MSSNKLKIFKSFTELDLNEDLLKGIYAYGFEKPSKIQEIAIHPFLSKKDIIAQSQSGTGKTGSFLISGIEILLRDKSLLTNQLLILAPTRELAIQINNVTTELIKYTLLKTEVFIGGTSIAYNIKNHITIGTPGRVYDLLRRNKLPAQNIKVMVLDEADEMLSRGFKEQVYNILKMITPICQIALFSATIPAEILTLADSFMREPSKILIQKEALTLEGIRQYYVALEKEHQKLDTLFDLYKTIKVTQCIIYTNTKQKTELLANALNDEGFTVGCMHGGLDQDMRKKVMDDFRHGQIKILITTDILSRGIDIQQISLVINYELPKENETYIHRIGRSGRFGRKGTAINFVTQYDITTLKSIEKFYDTAIQQLPADVESIIVS